MSKNKFAIGALIGAAAGLVAGILTAPKSGKETRQDIADKTGELKDGAAKKADQLKQKAGELKHKAEDAVDNAIHKK